MNNPVENYTILQGLVGSTVYGLNVGDGIEDRDEMGVCVEPIEMAMGLTSFEQYIYRTAVERTGDHNTKSQAGDLDLTVYSLRKFVRLALKGNPSILALFFVPPESLVRSTPLGEELQALAPRFVSRKAGGAFLGYLQAQKQRLLGERGQMRSNRPELVELYGFNTKYAMHMLRLGYQGVELLTTGCLSIPTPEPQRTELLGLRKGQMTLQDALTRAGELERELKDLLDNSALPAVPDTKFVESWMIEAYRNSAQWSSQVARHAHNVQVERSNRSCAT